MATIPTGISSYLQYGYETTFGTAASSTDIAFGHGVKITTLTRRNNYEQVNTLGNRDVTCLVPGRFEGTLTTEFFFGNSYFLKGVLDGSPVDAGSGPYTHTYTPSDTLPSITMENGIDLDTDHRALLLGGKITTCTMTFEQGAPARVSLDIPYVDETINTTLDGTPATETDDCPFFFAQATLEFPTSTTIDVPGTVEIVIDNTNEIIHGLGSRIGQQTLSKKRKYSIRCTVPFEKQSDFLDQFMGSTTGPITNPAEVATLKLTLTNGEAGTDLRSVVFSFANVKIDEESLAQEPGEPIREEITLIARTLTDVVATDNTTSVP